MTVRIIEGDVRAVLPTLPAGSVHCVVTSPPYWGLRDYGVAGQIGLERTLHEYVAEMVAVFRDVRRVLRDDGTCWLNLGDCYATGAGRVGNRPGGGAQGDRWLGNRGVHTAEQSGKHGYRVEAMGPVTQPNRMPQPGLKPKDLAMIPARVALALQDDGWWLRSDIIWAKDSVMPESVTDRPTQSHEHVFLLTKQARYFYDAVAIDEEGAIPAGTRAAKGSNVRSQLKDVNGRPPEYWEYNGRRNRRNVWRINPKPFADAHFATFPPELPEICIRAGTSERGCCPACAAPWSRVVEETFVPQQDVSAERGVRCAEGQKPMEASNSWGGVPRGTTVRNTTGWRPTCGCPAAPPVPCTVLDPFGGAGTTAIVADRLQRDALLVELNPEYAAMARRRITSDAPLFAAAPV